MLIFPKERENLHLNFGIIYQLWLCENWVEMFGVFYISWMCCMSELFV